MTYVGPGFAKILQSDYATFDALAVAEWNSHYPNSQSVNYTNPRPDNDSVHTWVRIENAWVYNLESLAAILNNQTLLNEADAIEAGMSEGLPPPEE